METTLSKVEDIQLTAKTPSEMLVAQAGLIEWVDKKLATLNADAKELEEATAHAKKLKWKSGTLERHWKIALKRIDFYDKMKAALIEGFYIVPNFHVQLFLIKTNKSNPAPKTETDTRYSIDKRQDAAILKIGEGDYKNPFPVVVRRTWKGEDQKEHYQTSATDWDEIEFPVSMAKPEIMQATSRAMAMKIFDEIGVFPPTHKEDPVIIGRIKLKVNTYTEKVVSFMIAWHLDTKVL